mgnify:CR=1 FL=1
MSIQLRPYQEEGVAAIIDRLQNGGSTLAVLATGLGKTVIAATVIERMREWSPRKRALALAHREELIYQAAKAINGITGEMPEIEMAGQHADLHMWRRAKVVIASKDTLRSPKRMAKFKPDEFGLVWVDEAHRAVAPSYQSIFKHFAGVPLLGVTATPDRTDEEALGKVFGSVAMVYELPDAIRDGWLCPVKQCPAEVHAIDYSKVSTSMGDLNGRELAEMMSNEEVLQGIADVTIRESRGRKTLVFAPPGFKTDGDDSFRSSERLTEIFDRHSSGCARLIMGTTPPDERANTLRDYRNGAFPILVNVGVLTEGFDDPSIEVIAMGRATTSRSLYSQMVGRSTRPLPGIVDGIDSAADRCKAIADSAKPYCEVIDFGGNAGKHKLVHVADILGGNYTEAEVELAEKKVRAAGGAVDVQVSLEDARDEIRRRADFDRMKRAAIKGKAQYSLTQVDPFESLNIYRPVTRGWDKAEPASEKQAKLLTRYKLYRPGLTKREATTLIGKLANNGWRKPAGLVSA